MKKYKGWNKLFKVSAGLIPILSIIFGFFVYTVEYENKIKAFFNTKVPINLSILLWGLIFMGLLWGISGIGIIVTNQLINLKQENDSYESKNLVLQERLSKQINMSFRENSKDQIISVIDKLLSNYSEVISVQIYECNKSKHKNMNNYEIKPTLYYKTREGHVANLIHERYCISDTLIDRFKVAKERCDSGDDKFIVKYIEVLTKELQKKACNNKKITEDTLNKYSLLILAMQCYLGENSFKLNNINEAFIAKLNELKRTGFLRGLLHGKYYKFRKEGNSHKGQRIYITRCIDIESKKHMFVIIINPDGIREGLGNYLEEIGEKFYQLLLNNTNLIYNEVMDKEA